MELNVVKALNMSRVGLIIIASTLFCLIFLAIAGPFFLSAYSVVPVSVKPNQFQMKISYNVINPSTFYLSPFSISVWIASPSGTNISSESVIRLQLPPLKQVSGEAYANITLLPSASDIISTLHSQNQEPIVYVVLSSNIFGLAKVTSIYEMNSTS
ncbi:MAG: hypothetical protein QXG05_01280 [Nitrososphaerota archaeon]